MEDGEQDVFYKGTLVGRVNYLGGKYHGRCVVYFHGTNIIERIVHYKHGILHGESIRYLTHDNIGFRFVEHYVDGVLKFEENIFDTDEYIGITTTSWKHIDDERGSYFDRCIPLIETVRTKKHF